MTVDQGVHLHVADEFDVTGPTKAQRGAEGVKRLAALAEFDPVDLHLLAGCGLESDDRLRWQGRSDPAQEGTQLAQPALVPLGGNLPIQDGGWYPERMGRRLPSSQVSLERRQLAGALLLTLVFRFLTGRQMAAHRVHRTSDFRRYSAKAEAVFPQNFDFHVHLVRDHRRLKSADLLNSVYQYSIAGLYQFTSAGDIA